MKRNVNIIVIFNQNKTKLLMCKRKKDPYQGKYNFVGGKIKPDEDHLQAAYRELQEETNITNKDVTLTHFMDFTYYLDDTLLETYVATLFKDVNIHGDENELVWIDINEDFKDDSRFAGDGNIYHIIKVIALSDYWFLENVYPLPLTSSTVATTIKASGSIFLTCSLSRFSFTGGIIVINTLVSLPV